MPSDYQRISRRRLLAMTMGAGCGLLSTTTLLPSTAVAANPQAEEMNMMSIIQSLRSIGKPVCLDAADRLAATTTQNISFDLHLRQAGLDRADARVLAEGIRRHTPLSNPFLRSFSASFNPELGDDGAATLAAAFPKTMTELGLVGCSVGDAGGRALIAWAKTAPDLQMICVEGNSFSAEVQSQFRDLAGQGGRPLIVV